METLHLAGQAALITGGGGAIGREIALAMGAQGVHVTVCDIDSAAAASVVDDIHKAGGVAQSIASDISSATGVEDLFRRLDESAAPPLNILVSTAGVIRYGGLLELTDSDLDFMVDVNIFGTYRCLREAARRMVSSGGGTIVNLASTAAYVSPRMPAAGYSLTKAAIRQLTVAAAVELAPLGVRVNAVAPGTIPTAFTKENLSTAEQIASAAERVPLGRLGVPADVVGATLFLTSSQASYITGQTVVVDGGLLGRAG